MRTEIKKDGLFQTVDTLEQWASNIIVVTTRKISGFNRRQLNRYVRDMVGFAGPDEAGLAKEALREGLKSNTSLAKPDRTFALRIVNLARPGERNRF